MSIVHGLSTVTKHDKWSYRSQGTGHVFYMSTPSHAIESVGSVVSEHSKYDFSEVRA